MSLNRLAYVAPREPTSQQARHRHAAEDGISYRTTGRVRSIYGLLKLRLCAATTVCFGGDDTSQEYLSTLTRQHEVPERLPVIRTIKSPYNP